MTKKQTNTGFPKPVQKLLRAVLRKIVVKENVEVGPNFRPGRGVVVYAPHRLSIGSNVSVGPRTIIQVDGEIGDFALIGMGVQIVGREDHAVDEVGVPIAESTWIGDRPGAARDSVSIGRDVWIGGSSVILSGVVIGEGSIIGAGSVVTKDIPAFSIAVGNPARVVRRRFSSILDEETHSRALDGRSTNG